MEDSDENFASIEDSIRTLEETLQTNETIVQHDIENSDSPSDSPENSQQDNTIIEDSVAQIPSMIRELVAATQNPEYVDPRE